MKLSKQQFIALYWKYFNLKIELGKTNIMSERAKIHLQLEKYVKLAQQVEEGLKKEKT